MIKKRRSQLKSVGHAHVIGIKQDVAGEIGVYIGKLEPVKFVVSDLVVERSN